MTSFSPIGNCFLFWIWSLYPLFILVKVLAYCPVGGKGSTRELCFCIHARDPNENKWSQLLHSQRQKENTQTDKCTNRETYKQTNAQTNKRINKQMHKQKAEN